LDAWQQASQIYYRGLLNADRTRGLEDLKDENMTLKRLPSELSLERLVLKWFPALQGW